MTWDHTHIRVINCPRCHEQCGWCSDPRWLHGTLRLPGLKKRCTVPGYAPEGDKCPLCAGSRRVQATTTYEAASFTTPLPEKL